MQLALSFKAIRSSAATQFNALVSHRQRSPRKQGHPRAEEQTGYNLDHQKYTLTVIIVKVEQPRHQACTPDLNPDHAAFGGGRRQCKS